ncbi:ATP-binding cassette domain-containing protein [Faecalicoccus acidiformans]|uniref:ribosomal protection-like ABC-F family protein n=1 Tax=Faecalicoccus acidiformans TaxID=915173 RepID=UPI0025A3C1F2|nr:ATP-binding cassette domain-containing protein [Faecalicoccus acidiformans]MDM8203313.1 ATP-binding cassette domain-containing protein [Faecalicoccus acidiformans]
MARILVEDLSFSYDGSEPIFDHVNFSIDTNWRLGFVGRNGRGKTTFLNLLMGNLEYQGKILSSVPFDYFPFSIPDPTQRISQIVSQLAPMAEDWQIVREFSYLELDPMILERSFDGLSQGEKTKVMLAILFVRPGNFLLIDEPTNHLDRHARQVLSAYLKRKRGFILVSHDREVLDGCVDHILAINRHSIDVQSGNYSAWFSAFEQKQEREKGENERLRKELRRLQESAYRTAGWSDRIEASKIGAADKGFVGHRSAKMMQRSKNIVRRKEEAMRQKKGLLKDVETTEPLAFQCLIHPSKTLIHAQDLTVFYDQDPLFLPVSWDLHTHDRLFLEGGNGSGKSSLIRAIRQEGIKTSDSLERASHLKISYVSQDPSCLRGSLKAYAGQYDIDLSLFLNILSKMGISRNQFDQDLGSYSDGQKKKVMIGRSLCESAHLYVWDEPLNFLDIYSRIQIEEAILASRPTMILVEHDAFFQKKIATKSVVLKKALD